MSKEKTLKIDLLANIFPVAKKLIIIFTMLIISMILVNINGWITERRDYDTTIYTYKSSQELAITMREYTRAQRSLAVYSNDVKEGADIPRLNYTIKLEDGKILSLPIYHNLAKLPNPEIVEGK